jgi:glycosidase
MRFGNLNLFESKLKEKVSDLIKLRKSNLSLLYGTTSVEFVDKDILVLKRRYFNQTSLAVFNKSNITFKYNDTLIEAKDYKIIVYEN